MKKSLIVISLIAGINFANANDVELLGKNVLKNTEDIKKILVELDEVKTKLSLKNNSSNMIAGDEIVVIKSNLSSSEMKEKVFYRTRVATVIRNSPSIYSGIVSKVKKGEVLEKIEFDSKPNRVDKMKDWIYVGNGFVRVADVKKESNVKN